MEVTGHTLEDALNSLVELGFTALEAEVYTFLLKESPATGYRAAKAISKPAANTYKAIESLQKKGAVIVEDGSSRLYKAVSVQEVLNRIKKNFIVHQERAEEVLTHLTANISDNRIYQLETVEQVLERSRHMLETAQETVLIDAFPRMLKMIKEDIEHALRRGVAVSVLCYEPIHIGGVKSVLHHQGSLYISTINGNWLNIVSDGRELMHSLCSVDCSEVINAVWSCSIYISWITHQTLSAAINYSGMHTALSNANSFLEMRKVMLSYSEIKQVQVPGYLLLLNQLKKE